MSIEAASEPLTARAKRVLGELCAASEPVTLVFIGRATPVHGRVSFAHGHRAAIVTSSPDVPVDPQGGRVVLTAMSRGRAVALSGTVVDQAEQSVSVAFSGDLKGSDPRARPRNTPAQPRRVELSWDQVCVVATELNHSQDGLCVVVPGDAPPLEVGTRVQIRPTEDADAVCGVVRHGTSPAHDGEAQRVGLRLDPNAPVAPPSRLASGPEAR